MDARSHWNQIYRTRPPTELSWYQPHARVSLELIGRASPPPNGPIIDVGGGASTLIDDLVEAGYGDLTVLDTSATALALARTRLGDRAAAVQWIEADILDALLPKARFSVWHDRAAFHFLTDPADRARYVAQARTAMRPGGFAVVATFADDGPTRCSGLDVVRYSAGTLHTQFGAGFRLVESERDEHTTPGGTRQAFVYCLFRLDEQHPGG
ncbi:MAG: class I SAM-dependent methyltransferase [Gemmatimonadales bacterium]